MKPYLFLHIPKTAGSSVAEVLPHGRSTIPDFFKNNKDNIDLQLYGYNSPRHHYTPEQFNKVGLEIPDDVYRFAFVRNPWDRVVSMFHHWTNINSRFVKIKRKSGEVVEYREKFPDSTFSSFVESTLHDAMQHGITEYKPVIRHDGENFDGVYAQPIKDCPFYYTINHGHFTPQVKYTHDRGGRQTVDFIGKYESLQEDVSKLISNLGGDPQSVSIPHVNQSSRAKKHYRNYYEDGRGLAKELVNEIYKDDIETYNYSF